MATLERPGLLQLPVYHADDSQAVIRLDANERTQNLPEPVRQAVVNRLSNLAFNRYPEMNMTTLKTLLADGLGVSVAEVAVGCGSSALLEAACQAFGGAGRKIAYPVPSFSMYEVYVRLADSEPVPLAMAADFKLDVPAAIRTLAEQQPALLLLCNPNNPTGTVMTPAELLPLLKAAQCPVLVDEAYIEFCPEVSLFGLQEQFPNLIIMRTFSKAYGLASARVGYMTAQPELVGLLERVLLPYHVNAMSLAAAETVYAMRTAFGADIAQTIAERQRMAAALAALSVQVYPSGTNFLFCRFKDADEAAALFEFLGQNDIGIRDFSRKPLLGGVRITIGTPAENDQVLKMVSQFLGSRGAV